MPADSSPPINHVVVLGLMATGKTAVGTALARRLGWRHVDNDESLEALAGATAAEVNERIGRDALHRLEADSLLAALGDNDRVVVSAAASTVEDERCRVALSQPGVFAVWLRTEPARLATRIQPGQRRPMLETDVERLLASQLRTRAPLYGSIADLILDAQSRTPDQLAAVIAAALDR